MIFGLNNPTNDGCEVALWQLKALAAIVLSLNVETDRRAAEGDVVGMGKVRQVRGSQVMGFKGKQEDFVTHLLSLCEY